MLSRMETIEPRSRHAASFGTLLRSWRQRRRLSQLDLACEAEISQRHLSFIESGRAQPSREMVGRLAECMDVPLRERNALLQAAGYAPIYVERSLQAMELAAARHVIELVLKGHEPYPALAVDGHWNLLMANGPLAALLAGVDAALLQAPVNALRVSLHPQGLAPRLVNFHEWRAHILHRLKQQSDNSADPALIALHRELESYPAPAAARPRDAAAEANYAGIAVPMELIVEGRVLRFLSTTTVFGTPMDISLAELAIETFFPADQATADAMRAFAQQPAAA